MFFFFFFFRLERIEHNSFNFFSFFSSSGWKLQLRHVQDDLRQRVRAGSNGRRQVNPGLPNPDQRFESGWNSLHGPRHELLGCRIWNDFEQVAITVDLRWFWTGVRTIDLKWFWTGCNNSWFEMILIRCENSWFEMILNRRKNSWFEIILNTCEHSWFKCFWTVAKTIGLR